LILLLPNHLAAPWPLIGVKTSGGLCRLRRVEAKVDAQPPPDDPEHVEAALERSRHRPAHRLVFMFVFVCDLRPLATRLEILEAAFGERAPFTAAIAVVVDARNEIGIPGPRDDLIEFHLVHGRGQSASLVPRASPVNPRDASSRLKKLRSR
jgi:hypothetical protein